MINENNIAHNLVLLLSVCDVQSFLLKGEIKQEVTNTKPLTKHIKQE